MQNVEDAAEDDGDNPPDAEAGEDQREAGHSIILGKMSLQLRLDLEVKRKSLKYCVNVQSLVILYKLRQTGVLLEAGCQCQYLISGDSHGTWGLSCVSSIDLSSLCCIFYEFYL